MFFTTFVRWRPALPTSARLLRRGAGARTACAVAEPADPVDGEDPSGCGWFQSSHDLRAGIDLREMVWNDAEMPRQLAGVVECA